MKAEEAVLVSLPNKPTVSVDVKQHSTNLTDRVITRFVSPGDEAMKQSHRETVTRHAARLHLGFLGEFPRVYCCADCFLSGACQSNCVFQAF